MKFKKLMLLSGLAAILSYPMLSAAQVCANCAQPAFEMTAFTQSKETMLQNL